MTTPTSTPSPHIPIAAVIFDFDGLIMDTETATYEAWREIYAEHGQTLTVETWSQCVGSDFGHYDPRAELEAAIGRSLDWKQIDTERRERIMKILSTYDALPGVRDRLREAAVLGLPCAVASSSPRWWVEHWVRHLGLFDSFHHLTTLDDTGKVKPDPSLFLLAAERLGKRPGQALVLEDSLNGLRAAQSAGMRCIVIPGTITQHFSFEGAWYRHGSMQDFTLRGFMEPRGIPGPEI